MSRSVAMIGHGGTAPPSGSEPSTFGNSSSVEGGIVTPGGAEIVSVSTGSCEPSAGLGGMPPRIVEYITNLAPTSLGVHATLMLAAAPTASMFVIFSTGGRSSKLPWRPLSGTRVPSFSVNCTGWVGVMTTSHGSPSNGVWGSQLVSRQGLGGGRSQLTANSNDFSCHGGGG